MPSITLEDGDGINFISPYQRQHQFRIIIRDIVKICRSVINIIPSYHAPKIVDLCNDIIKYFECCEIESLKKRSDVLISSIFIILIRDIELIYECASFHGGLKYNFSSKEAERAKINMRRGVEDISKFKERIDGIASKELTDMAYDNFFVRSFYFFLICIIVCFIKDIVLYFIYIIKTAYAFFDQVISS